MIAITVALAMTSTVSFADASADEAKVEKSDHITADLLVAMKRPSDVQVSPDGNWVAYVVRRNDMDKDEGKSQIWMSSTDGKHHIPLTAAYANASSPRWNPDGSSIAFIGTRGEGEDLKSQVWLLDRRGGEAQQHTDVKQGVSGFTWSPDGSRMLLAIKDPKPEDKEEEGKDKDTKAKKAKGKDSPEPYVIDRLQFKQDYVGYLDRLRTHLYLFDGEGKPEQITSGDYDDSDPVWSPDGTQIAFYSKRDGDPDANNNGDIWVVSADKGLKDRPLTQVTKNKGNDHSPVWSPDGKMIAYVTSTEPEKLWYDADMLAVSSADGSGDARILTAELDRIVYQPEFSENGKDIYFLMEDGGAAPLMSVNVKSGKIKSHSSAEHTLWGYDIGAKGTIATIQSSHHVPGNIHIIEKGKTKQITALNKELLDGVKLAKVERLKVPGWNGEMVESFVYYPADYDASKPYPTIFHLHGGPTAQHDTSFDSWGQFYAAQGYITVMPNPHGSTGYGEAFTYSLNANWGVPDTADVEAIADHLVEAGISDGDKLGVGGWSYGGILTNYVITNTERFAGAVSGASEVNLRANYGHDHYQHFWEVELGLPWENVEAWERINMFNDLGKVTTPTLVIGGQLDWNVPIQNSEQMYQVLKRRGIDTQLVVYPGEHHGISRPSFQKDVFLRYQDWFDKYVRKIKDKNEKLKVE
ncbi:acylaminoacyl-peptidase [Kordiimonas sediminis]|uniref:Acylaminoacyl-peptidase n=2 Tax=Kordiimonas sediminis TaxID=1735581 RepID=A0A919E9Q2_9PROT|nr:acylaminoacyl-peptidase [Kordiimonas sediminis]